MPGYRREQRAARRLIEFGRQSAQPGEGSGEFSTSTRTTKRSTSSRMISYRVC